MPLDAALGTDTAAPATPEPFDDAAPEAALGTDTSTPATPGPPSEISSDAASEGALGTDTTSPATPADPSSDTAFGSDATPHGTPPVAPSATEPPRGADTAPHVTAVGAHADRGSAWGDAPPQETDLESGADPEPAPGTASAVEIAAEPAPRAPDLDEPTTRFTGFATEESTARIPRSSLPDEPTTRIGSLPTAGRTPDADDTPTPPHGIPVAHEEADNPSGQPAVEASGTAEGSSSEPDDGPADTAHRNSTAQ